MTCSQAFQTMQMHTDDVDDEMVNFDAQIEFLVFSNFSYQVVKK